MQTCKQPGILQTSLIHSRKFRKYTSYCIFANLKVGQLSDSRMPNACHYSLVTLNPKTQTVQTRVSLQPVHVEPWQREPQLRPNSSRFQSDRALTLSLITPKSTVSAHLPTHRHQHQLDEGRLILCIAAAFSRNACTAAYCAGIYVGDRPRYAQRIGGPARWRFQYVAYQVTYWNTVNGSD